MVVTLKNKKIEFSVNSFGAEMNSLKNAVTGKDYLWTGNPDVWKFHAPVLFPHCGKTKDGYVIIDGQKYPLKSNGFAGILNLSLWNRQILLLNLSFWKMRTQWSVFLSSSG